ncbi:MAG: hypothetical protein GY714_09605 [Desulfobacterales bacterium]|nr:hypothetical protein [Desulfobacterales bacterium]
MITKIYTDDMQNLKLSLNFIKLIVLILTIGLGVSSYYSYKAVTYQRTVIKPLVGSYDFSISDSDANNTYIERMSESIIYLSQNYTPKGVDRQFNALIQMCTASFKPKLERTLYENKKNIKKFNIVSSFIVNDDIKINREKGIIEILGNSSKYMKDKEYSRDTKIFVINYKIVNGQFLINNFYEKKK